MIISAILGVISIIPSPRRESALAEFVPSPQFENPCPSKGGGTHIAPDSGFKFSNCHIKWKERRYMVITEINTESSERMFLIQFPKDFDPGMMFPRRMMGEKMMFKIMLTYDLISIQRTFIKVKRTAINKIKPSIMYRPDESMVTKRVAIAATDCGMGKRMDHKSLIKNLTLAIIPPIMGTPKPTLYPETKLLHFGAKPWLMRRLVSIPQVR